MTEKLFIRAIDVDGHPVHLNLHQISTIKLLPNGEALLATRDIEMIHLPPEEATKLGSYLAEMTSKQPPMITK